MCSIQARRGDMVTWACLGNKILRMASNEARASRIMSTVIEATIGPDWNFYERDYSSTFDQPRSYIRARGVFRREVGKIVSLNCVACVIFYNSCIWDFKLLSISLMSGINWFKYIFTNGASNWTTLSGLLSMS